MGCMADVILYLVDRSRFDRIMAMRVEEITSGMESSEMRGLRPKQDARFHRDFDVDLEGDILEAIDSFDDFDPKVRALDLTDNASSDLFLSLAKWCSSSQWRCWEARLFLYVEPSLSNTASKDLDFTSPLIWKEFSDKLSRTDRSSFSESVVLDWMSRREEMGETMEPSEDPMILPTMNSHRSLSESLFLFIQEYRKQDLHLLVGKEYLDSGEWNLGGSPISEINEVLNV